MKASMYQSAVPPCVRALTNLAAILEKGAAHAEARKIEPAVLLNARLYPDMLPLTKQIQIATDTASGGAARLAGKEPPVVEHNEATFAALVARVQQTIQYLNSITSEQIDGTEDRTVSVSYTHLTLPTKRIV